MKSAFYFCAAALAFFALPASAMADGISYDCDTAADHFSELNLPVSGLSFVVAGHVQLIKPAGSKKYVPLARVQIASATAPGETPNVYAGFSISALAADPTKTPSGASAIQMLSYNLNGKDDEILPFSMTTKPGTTQSFSLAYNGSEVSVNLGNETKTFPLKTADPVVRLICSTGEFLFTGLTIKTTP